MTMLSADFGLREIIAEIRRDIMASFPEGPQWRKQLFQVCLNRLEDVELLQKLEKTLSGLRGRGLRQQEAADLVALPESWLADNRLMNDSQALYYLARMTAGNWETGSAHKADPGTQSRAWYAFLQLLARSPISPAVMLAIFLSALARSPENASILQTLGAIALVISDYDSAFVIFGRMASSAMKEGVIAPIEETLTFFMGEKLRHDDSRRLHALGRMKSSEIELPVGVSPEITAIRNALESGKFHSEDRVVVIQGERGSGRRHLASCIHRWTTPGAAIHSLDLADFRDQNALFALLHGRAGSTGNSGMPSRGILQMIGSGTIVIDGMESASMEFLEDLRMILARGGFRKIGDLTGEYIPFRGRFILCSVSSGPQKGQGDSLDGGLNGARIAEKLGAPLEVLPPLRKRIQDIPWLVEAFLARLAQSSGGVQKSLDRAVRDRLKSYSWPGNVQELRRAVEAMAELSGGKVIREAFLPERILERFR